MTMLCLVATLSSSTPECSHLPCIAQMKSLHWSAGVLLRPRAGVSRRQSKARFSRSEAFPQFGKLWESDCTSLAPLMLLITAWISGMAVGIGPQLFSTVLRALAFLSLFSFPRALAATKVSYSSLCDTREQSQFRPLGLATGSVCALPDAPLSAVWAACPFLVL